MPTLELSPNVYIASAGEHQLATRIARGIVLVLLAMMYSGGVLFLVTVSPYLLYGFYLTILVLSMLCLFLDQQAIQRLRSVVPCCYWLILYALWSTLVSPISGEVFSEAVRGIIFRCLLILGAIVVALPDMQSFVRFARLIQVVVILNCMISIWEFYNPELITTIAYTLNPYATAFNVLRPAGLWSNPDEASFAFLFALLISGRSHGILAWIGRTTAVCGIYLSASRTGSYILVLYVIIFLFYKIRNSKITFGHITVLINVIASLSAILFVVYYVSGTPHIDISRNPTLSRILDFRESDQDTTRPQVAAAATEAALNGPWQGYGLFTFQDPENYLKHVDIGAHNIYITVWGEAGIFGFLGYLLFLALGISLMVKTRMSHVDRLIAMLMWATYLLLGFVWHNQFTSFSGLIYLGLVYYFPRIAEVRTVSCTPTTGIALRRS